MTILYFQCHINNQGEPINEVSQVDPIIVNVCMSIDGPRMKDDTVPWSQVYVDLDVSAHRCQGYIC